MRRSVQRVRVGVGVGVGVRVRVRVSVRARVMVRVSPKPNNRPSQPNQAGHLLGADALEQVAEHLVAVLLGAHAVARVPVRDLGRG